MPAKPSWFRRIGEIERNLAAIADPLLDRRAVAAIFGVSQTEAGRLLRRLSATRVGNSNVVIREIAIAFVHGLRQSEDVDFEERRVRRLDERLTEAGRDLAARRVILPAAPPVHTIAELPGNVRLEPGRLAVDFHGAIDLLTALHAIVQIAGRDWLGFSRACGD